MQTIADQIQIKAAAIGAFCRRHGVARLSLFGSALRGEDHPESDLDLLVEFLPDRRVSLFDVGGMTVELREIFGREIDLRTAEDLSPYFRDQVVALARTVYAA